LIGSVIHLLIESSFTTEEKRERVQRIQQRSAVTATPKDVDEDEPSDDITGSTESAVSGNELNHHENTLVALGRTDCIMQANRMLREILSMASLISELQENEQDYQTVFGFFCCFCNELESLNQAIHGLTI